MTEQYRPEISDALAISESQETKRGLLFPAAVMQTLRELSSYAQERGETELPEENRYLLSEEDGLLIQIARRWPRDIGYGYKRSTDPTVGYFAYGYEIYDGKPIHQLPQTIFTQFQNSRFFNPKGSYKVIEITDEEKRDNPFSFTGLTPTHFPSAYAIALGMSGPQRPALPGRKQEGVIAAFIKELRIRDVGQTDKIDRATGVRKTIIERHMKDRNQGLRGDIDSVNLVLTPREKKAVDEIFAGSQGVGLRVKRVDTSKAFPSGRRDDPVYSLMSQTRLAPLVVTHDMAGQRNFGWINNLMKEHNLFSVIEIDQTGAHASKKDVVRQVTPGYFTVYEPDPEALAGVYAKIGFDFMLTHHIRDAALMFG